MPRLIGATLLAALLPTVAPAQDLPAEYQAVLASLNKKGDFKDGVFKVNIPRSPHFDSLTPGVVIVQPIAAGAR